MGRMGPAPLPAEQLMFEGSDVVATLGAAQLPSVGMLFSVAPPAPPPPPPAPRGARLPASLGYPVTTREFSLLALVTQEWGGEFSAPDHAVYQFNDGQRRFDSTDMGETGFYRRGVAQLPSVPDPIVPDAPPDPPIIPPPVGYPVIADADFFIGPAGVGNDANDGSQAAPWAITALGTKTGQIGNKFVAMLDGIYAMPTTQPAGNNLQWINVSAANVTLFAVNPRHAKITGNNGGSYGRVGGYFISTTSTAVNFTMWGLRFTDCQIVPLRLQSSGSNIQQCHFDLIRWWKSCTRYFGSGISFDNTTHTINDTGLGLSVFSATAAGHELRVYGSAGGLNDGKVFIVTSVSPGQLLVNASPAMVTQAAGTSLELRSGPKHDNFGAIRHNGGVGHTVNDCFFDVIEGADEDQFPAQPGDYVATNRNYRAACIGQDFMTADCTVTNIVGQHANTLLHPKREVGGYTMRNCFGLDLFTLCNDLDLADNTTLDGTPNYVLMAGGKVTLVENCLGADVFMLWNSGEETNMFQAPGIYRHITLAINWTLNATGGGAFWDNGRWDASPPTVPLPVRSFYNNILASYSGAVGTYGYERMDPDGHNPGGFFEIHDFNCYQNFKIVNLGVHTYTTLAEWRTDTGLDQNSIEAAPGFLGTGGDVNTAIYYGVTPGLHVGCDANGVLDPTVDMGCDVTQLGLTWTPEA